MRKIDELKELLKGIAAEIKQDKFVLVKTQKAHGRANNLMFLLCCKRQNYRDYHIAYCELRGKTRDQIEKPKYSKPNEFNISMIKKAYAWTEEEIAAYNERKAKHEQREQAICVG